MATQVEPVKIDIPQLPAEHDDFIKYLTARKNKPMIELLEPYKKYDAELRKAFAQQPDHPAVARPNVVPVFAGQEENVKIRARSLKDESKKEKESYIMPLPARKRRANDSPAIVQSLREFRTHFNVFSESALADLDWANVVAAGSSVVTPLLAVPKKHAGSKRALREYYHEQIAPASDVDLFLYGLTEEQALEKIKQIEQSVRDSILTETTTVRTKNAITIASQYPTRHVQIVLRIYKSISEILTGFDVDCSCAAYDGKQVYASPRALAAYMTQTNVIDLTRRSPSYENRLSKYAHRGFEVYWPNLDRSRVDPTIFERSFGRTEGLARLLILEKLPKDSDRVAYLDQRRAERGRPAVNRNRMNQHRMRGNIKDNHEDEVAEWVDAEEVSDYHTFTVPYGPKFHARKIEKLLYTKDLLLNSEWNLPKEREVNLHRHPAFFGRADDVFRDCCGHCPVPSSMEEEEVAKEERKIYVSGEIAFIKDNAGRQTIGSFNPLTADDWTEMAYVGNTQRLCQAIVDGDAEYVSSWLGQEGNDPNTRDYTGRAPLHLAVISSTPEIVQLLIENGARLVARLVDGRTALHLAAMRGNVEIVQALLRKSEANEEEEERKVDARRAVHNAAKNGASGDIDMQDSDIKPADRDSDIDMIDDASEDENMDATTESSMVNIKIPDTEAQEKVLEKGEDEDEPDVYDVNVVAWDTAVSPLHLAIVNGHTDVVLCLVQEFGADILLPVKLFHDHDKSARGAILTLVLALRLPLSKSEEMARTLIKLGATIAQADLNQSTTLQFAIVDCPDMLETLIDADKVGFARSVNHLSGTSSYYRVDVQSPLMTAIRAKDSLTALRLLTGGAKANIDFKSYMKFAAQSQQANTTRNMTSTQNKETFEKTVEQPVISAIDCELPKVARELIEHYSVDPNSLTKNGWSVVHDEHTRRYTKGESLLDIVRAKVKQLREWEFKERQFDEPIPLQDDMEYLEELKDGTYVKWTTQTQLDSAKYRYKQDRKSYEHNVEQAKLKTGVEEKRIAVEQMADEFERLEQILVKQGGKTFEEMHPDIKPDEDHYNNRWGHGNDASKPKPFYPVLSFKLPDLTPETESRYMELFEATWSGDATKVKELTLTTWKDSDDDAQPPLKVAVQDHLGLSPFAIAIIHRQFELAKTIMEIAHAQYVPPDQERNERYKLDGGNGDDSQAEDDGDDGVAVFSEIVDEHFTVETIGEVSTQVKSRITPLTMMLWQAPVAHFISEGKGSSPRSPGLRDPYSLHGKRTNTGSIKISSLNHLSQEKRGIVDKPNTLIQFALYNDDQDMLSYLLSLGEEYTKAAVSEEDEDAKRFFTINDADFLTAIKLDRPHLVAEIIKRTGAGIPINELIKKSGIEYKEKPRYYQGLSVYGQKRKDWAAAGRNETHNEPIENHCPPLLEAARQASLETMEWLLSDSPMRCYKHFADINKNDKRIKYLSETKGGFEASVTKFLNARSHLAVHCCVMGSPVPEATKLLEFLVKEMPKAVDARNSDGVAPLHLAFRLYREDAVKILIAAGADQTCRDKHARNVLHHLLTPGVEMKQKLERTRTMVDLIDERLVSNLFLERSATHPGSLTPLAAWVQGSNNNHSNFDDQILRLILSYSGGAELNIVNGEGHTPLHVAVRQQRLDAVKTFLEHDPTLLLRENATGRTPFEMVEDREIASMCNDPPPLPGAYNYSPRNPLHFGARATSNWQNNIVDRNERDFAEDTSEQKTGESDSKRQLWKLCEETRIKLESEDNAKRRIVTLNEANEVAKRLAATKAHERLWGRRHMRRNRTSADEDDVPSASEEEQEGSDEVQLWLDLGKISL